MIKTFIQAVKYLESFIPIPEKKHPGKLGLKRMIELMKSLGNPQFKYSTIHVGGTSGKGSTATIIASILATHYKVGLHTSPHLVRINERISLLKQSSNRAIEQVDISDTDFITLINDVAAKVEIMQKGKYGSPSYFEIVTAMAFLYFSQKKVDIAVIEVGMGGKFDATNVIKPQVAVLTNVGLDHTEILGDTVEEIAADKVGIIKKGMSVITGVTKTSIIQIIEVKCRKEGAEISLLKRDFTYAIMLLNSKGSIFSYYGERTYKDLHLGLLGSHQVENAALAIRVIECMNGGMHEWRNKINERDIRKALLNVNIEGRLEIVKKKSLIILDGAHNPDKMRALVSSIKAIWPGKKVTAIVAIKEDKNAREMLKILLPLCQKIMLTQYIIKIDIGDIVSFAPEELKRIINYINRPADIQIINSPIESLKHATKVTKKEDIILVTGSLYLVGEIKKRLAYSV